jgi:rubredoxin
MSMQRMLHIYNHPILFDTPFYTVTSSHTWMCLICGWIYDESLGAPEHGIAPGTRWSDVPMNWTCPECGARKEDFELVQI